MLCGPVNGAENNQDHAKGKRIVSKKNINKCLLFVYFICTAEKPPLLWVVEIDSFRGAATAGVI